jgi:thiol-disulfide isomerase/thioredoxin
MQTLTNHKPLHYFSEAQTEMAFLIAKQKQLPVLIDFWAPQCKGCKKMEITTYQSREILSYMEDYFVFVKYDITNRSVPKITSSPILWTPTFIVFANDGSEVRKITGYLDNGQFRTELEIGRALASLRKGKPHTALEILETLIKEPPHIVLLPEAIYWAGVASYFLNKRNAESLIPYWERLIRDHPESTWAERANCLHVKL